MADYSFGYGGIGSGLDISSIVSQLVSADRAPQDARLNKLEATAKFKLSGLGSLTSAFDGLKTALDALQKSDALGARSVSTVGAGGSGGGTGTGTGSSTTAVSASVGKGTPLGRYEVEVLSLASAHKLVGGGMAAETTFGAGSLRLEIGEASVEIAIAEGASLADVRSAINQAGASHGVEATLLRSDDGHHLSVSGAKTGAANAISLTVASGGTDLQGLVDGLEERSPASDARILVDGLQTTAATNSIGDAVPGLTLKLQQVGTSTVEVSADPAGSRSAMEGFVKAYNAAIKAVADATTYNAETRTPAALTGDAQARGAVSQLRDAMGGILADLAAQGLDASTLGLQTRGYPSADGSLVLDSAKFDAAMADNAAAITAAFTGPDGMAARLNAVVQGYVGSDGAFTARKSSLDDQIKSVGKQREALDTRMEAVAKRYQAQFVALDSLMAQMSSTSNYLSQQLAALATQTRG